MSVFNYQKDTDGIVTVTMDMSGPVNAMNEEYRQAMGDTVTRLEAEPGLTGVVLASAKKVFFAGGDLKELLAIEKGQEAEFMALSMRIKDQLRRLETLPVPVVAAINGAALGGGFEIALACNYRLAAQIKPVVIGLPEVTLGLLPGGGGIVRLVNLLGLEKALPFLLEGRKVNAETALSAGLIDATVDSAEQLLPAARAYILAHQGDASAAVQPWDRKGFNIPGGTADSPRLAQLIAMAAPQLRQKTRGLLPAPEHILSCAVEAARLDVDTALRIESRALAYLLTTPEAKNQITTLFFQLNKLAAGASRPAGVAPFKASTVGVIGAGLMGQGIAYVAALAGLQVVVRVSGPESAAKAGAYAEQQLAKKVAKGHMDAARKTALLALITATTDDEPLQQCELIIEAVDETLAVKNQLMAAIEPRLPANVLWASNTSSLPITTLAAASSRPANVIGLHFFSPADKMPLVEIIKGENTSDETLAQAFDFVRQVGKTPIVVHDSPGFYTSRTFATYLDEGCRLLTEGVHPVRIENLAKAVGMPLGPLQIHDETSLELTRKLFATQTELGVEDQWGEQQASRQVIQTLVDQHGRGGRRYGGGFYQYAEDGRRSLWPPLLEMYYRAECDVADQDVKDRLLFRPVIESLKCLESGVLHSVSDGNIGSLMGIGAPAWTGGYIQFVNTYGLQRFIDRCNRLAEHYGERFRPPAIVAKTLQAGELFG